MRLGIARPARVEGENVLIEHALKQTNIAVAFLHNQLILRLISCENSNTQLLVKQLRRLDVFYRQANREIPSSMISSQAVFLTHTD